MGATHNYLTLDVGEGSINLGGPAKDVIDDDAGVSVIVENDTVVQVPSIIDEYDKDRRALAGLKGINLPQYF